MFGNSKITMMFDPKSYDLRQWTITDAQGKDTTVMIFNIKEGVSFPPDTFAIDYTANRELNTKTDRFRRTTGPFPVTLRCSSLRIFCDGEGAASLGPFSSVDDWRSRR